MLTDLSWLRPTMVFPPPSENERLAMYEENDKLYEGKHDVVWKDLWDVQDLQVADDLASTFFSTPYGPRKLEFNWFLVLCNVFSDFLVGEPPRLLGGDKTEQSTLDNIRLRSDFNVVLYNTAKNMIKYNHGVVKVRFKGNEYREPGSVIETIKPSIWFPIVNPDNEDEYVAHVLAWTFMERIGSVYAKLLKVEIHEAGTIFHRLYWMNGDKIDHEVPLNTSSKYGNLMMPIPEGADPATFVTPLGSAVDTGVPYPLVIVVKNPTDDFANIKNLVHELETRIIKVASILDIHSRPLMAGPDNMLSTDMETGEDKLILNGRFFPIRDPGIKPTYITWDGKLNSSFAQMDKITDMLYKVTDLTPAALGDYSQGMQVSGSAWRRLLVRTLAKTNRLRLVFDVPVKRMLFAASTLDTLGRIPGSTPVMLHSIGWQDGLPKDMKEDTAIEQARKNSGLTSKLSAIMRLDDCTKEEAEEEIERMKREIPDAPREQSPIGARLRNEGRQPRADLTPDKGEKLDVMK